MTGPIAHTTVMTVSEVKALLAKPKKRSKFGNVHCQLDGHSFDSLAEMSRYAGYLKIRLLAGEIRGLHVHPIFPLKINGTHIADYEADFTYIDVKTGVTHVEDVKGTKGGKGTITDVFRIKAKLFAICYAHLKLEIIS